MRPRREPLVGILPPGALGVALFHHLTDGSRRVDGDVVFLHRGAGGGAERWAGAAAIRVETPAGVVDVPVAQVMAGDLVTAEAKTAAGPRVVLVCTNPDQLFDVLGEFIVLVEREHAAGRLTTRALRLPALVLCANGIYYQRVRSSFIELLEEATLLGRLPDLWPHLMPAIVGRLMRGVTIQTAVRTGAGAAAVYRPGPSGRTRLAGGDAKLRAAAVHTLASRGGWFEDAGELSATRVEFDKALVNLSSNVFGQLAAVDAEGRFTALTVAEIATPARHARIRELVTAVLRVGRGVRVYGERDTVDAVFDEVLEGLRSAAAHVPSSVQWLEQRLRGGAIPDGLPPTETWLLKPLQHYARSLHDVPAISYFESLEQEVLRALGRAKRRLAGSSGPAAT